MVLTIVQEHIDSFIKNEDFYDDMPNLLAAIQVAKTLVSTI